MEASEPVALPGSTAPSTLQRQVPRGRHGVDRQEIIPLQQARLIDAMVQVVAETGVADARVAAVCSRAGISTREFYNLYKRKEDCLLAAFHTGAELVRQEAIRVFALAEGPWSHRVTVTLGSMFRQLAANPTFAKFSIVEVPRAGTQVFEHFDSVVGEFEAVFIESSDRGLDLNLRKDIDPHSLGTYVVGGTLHRLARCVRDDRAAELATLAPEVTSFLVGVLLGYGVDVKD
jgi:AcrR family transcriptional regulator